MKQTIAILLLGLLLFNWFGYRVWVNRVEANANVALEAQLDNNKYEESQLLLIKIPVTQLSYYNSSRDFERVNGQVEMNGVKYQFVKRRLFNDSLELFCIPNQAATRLQLFRNDFLRSLSEQQGRESKQTPSHPNIFKSFPTDDYTVNDLPTHLAPSSVALNRPANYAEALTSLYHFTSEHPPDQL